MSRGQGVEILVAAGIFSSGCGKVERRGFKPDLRCQERIGSILGTMSRLWTRLRAQRRLYNGGDERSEKGWLKTRDEQRKGRRRPISDGFNRENQRSKPHLNL